MPQGNDDEDGLELETDDEQPADPEEQALVDGTMVVVGGVRWQTNVGRVVDPFLRSGYKDRAKFNLHNYTEATELQFFTKCFPYGEIEDMATEMTRNGLELGFGVGWSVSPGDIWQFLGYNMAMMLLHTGGPKEDLWLKSGASKYEGSVFVPPDLGQYGLTYSRFVRMMRAFTLPRYSDANDPFDPIRRFITCWNDTMGKALDPGPTLVVDESMALWKGRGMPGLMAVPRKPTPLGRESHTTADGETGVIIFIEPYEGKDRMAKKEYVTEWGKNPSKALRCVKPWFRSARCVILDAGFASLKCCKGMSEHGMFMIGNVKGGHSGFPKDWLLEHVPVRGTRVSCTTTITTSSGEQWDVVAAADRDRQPMSLIGTAGTTSMGQILVRNFTAIRADGTFHVRSATLEQWDIHATYRRHFNSIDKHNSRRQGGVSFEDTWKTHRWWVREFQMAMGISEVNSWLLWRRFRQGASDVDFDFFRRRLAYQLLNHPRLMLERGEGMTLRGISGLDHVLLENPKATMGLGAKAQVRSIRGRCRYCGSLTMWSCSCSPLLQGMNREEVAKVMFVCSPRQNPLCHAHHLAGREPRQARSQAIAASWETRKKARRSG